MDGLDGLRAEEGRGSPRGGEDNGRLNSLCFRVGVEVYAAPRF